MAERKSGDQQLTKAEMLKAIFGEKYPKDSSTFIVREQKSYALLKEEVDEVMGSLTQRERRVMRSRFGLDDGRTKTLAEVGQEIGRSRWTVSRIERSALRKLRQPVRVQPLKDFLA